ncbi:MAG: choice-of-anchor B family protein, partial [Saprospiraceae bacterium]
MIKKMFAMVALLAATQVVFAQLNLTYISDLPYNQDLNDIWGYVAPDGTEYAIVGAANGTSVVSLADPANPEEVGYVPGDNSIWRDIKVWDDFAYVVTDDENSNDGLTVIDLSDLPNSISSIQMTDFGNLGTLNRCHNIWIDEFGYAYLAGCNLNSGGMIYLDCDANPAMPEIIGFGPAVYSHDVYTRDNLMYSSEINDGVFTVYDVTDKANTIALGNQETDFSFTHNGWLNDAGDVLFTTDELENAPIGSYDVSDPSDIKLLDLYKPLETLGDGVIPHNVHVWNDWIIISYYTDGCIILDGSNPENLIEVGNFDTYFPSNVGFNGAWGAYPFFPSGLIAISDIDNGLFILEPDYVRACWLEGKVTDADNGASLNAVDVSINTTELNQEMSNASGDYATGLAIAGTYEVTYTKAGYIPKTLTDVVLENGELTIRDVELTRLPTYEVTGLVIREENGSPIEDARVLLENDDFSFEVTTDANGIYLFPEVNDGDYKVVALKWGYRFEDTDITVAGDPYTVADLAKERGHTDELLYDSH